MLNENSNWSQWVLGARQVKSPVPVAGKALWEQDYSCSLTNRVILRSTRWKTLSSSEFQWAKHSLYIYGNNVEK